MATAATQGWIDPFVGGGWGVAVKGERQRVGGCLGLVLTGSVVRDNQGYCLG